MARTRNQLDNPDNVNTSDDVNQAGHSAGNVMVGVVADIPRQLNEDQGRALAPDATLVATMKRMFEEY